MAAIVYGVGRGAAGGRLSLAGVEAPRTIDVLHLGTPGVIACYEQDDAIVDPGPEVTRGTLLARLDAPPRRILLTHVHLDHSGAVGALVRDWPEVEVWVHERGAAHLVDPGKLVASATRIYGEDMGRLWGEVLPVPERNLRILTGGERIGPWRVAYTPGHASHHVAYLHEPTGTAFAGDVAGVRIAPAAPLPPTPPPDIDLDAWHASLDVLAAWHPARLAVTHFGVFDDVAGQLGAMHERLDRFGALARTTDDAGYQEAIVAEMRRSGAGEVFRQAMPPAMQWAGLDRYWSKRAV
jgi:glyoxylase-like metal-dependent hydrolase (beta-lactamase superfamily II)